MDGEGACHDAFEQGLLNVSLDVEDLLVVVQGGKQVTATCIWDGDAVYTHIPCTSLSDTATCKTTFRHTDADTCKDYGMHLTPIRSATHATRLFQKWGASTDYFRVVNVYREQNGCGGCTSHAMNSGVAGQSSWQTFDDGPWWLRDTPFSEPNGDYTADCWMVMYGFQVDQLQFNDGNCDVSTSKYVCIQGSVPPPTTTTTPRPAGDGCKAGVAFARKVNDNLWLCSDGAETNKGWDRVGQVRSGVVAPHL